MDKPIQGMDVEYLITPLTQNLSCLPKPSRFTTTLRAKNNYWEPRTSLTPLQHLLNSPVPIDKLNV
jgi:hypothetical protein